MGVMSNKMKGKCEYMLVFVRREVRGQERLPAGRPAVSQRKERDGVTVADGDTSSNSEDQTRSPWPS